MMIEIDERVDLSRLVPTTMRHDCAHQLRRPTAASPNSRSDVR